MPIASAGLLLYRSQSGSDSGDGLEVLLVHMGGPFWAGKDARAWSIPKGEYAADEDPLATAFREFAEELGAPAPAGDRHELGQVRQSSGKTVTAWALDADFDATTVTPATSNTFELGWPPKSGRVQQFPEIDRAEWFDLATARPKIVAAQEAFLDRLLGALEDRSSADRSSGTAYRH